MAGSSTFRTLLDAVVTALGVVSKVGSLPGVNLIPYVSTIAGAAGLLKLAIEKGENVAADIASFKETFANGLPSEADRAALDLRIAALRARVHAPLPPQEEGEPN